MKLTRTTKRASGMTLLELTVVILVLLSLISILFIGARAWKAGSDRAGCILNLRNVQQAVRSYANMYNAATVPAGELLGDGKFIETQPVCPGGGTYAPPALSVAVTVPAISALAMTCSKSAVADGRHVPDSIAGW